MSESLRLHRQTHGHLTGDAVPLLLIHGGGSTIETNWGTLIPHLVATRPVIAVETQGHGRTPSTERLASFENSADDVAAVLDELGVERVDVLGFSNGGNVAMRLAMRHPHRVRRQIIASSFHRREGMVDGFWEGMAAAEISGMPQVYLDADRAIDPDPAHQQRLFDNDSGQMLRFVDWPDADLAAMTTPTLFVVADQDVVRVDHTVAMAALTPGARLLVLPGNHGDYLGEVLAAGGDLRAMHATLPWLLGFLDEGEAA